MMSKLVKKVYYYFSATYHRKLLDCIQKEYNNLYGGIVLDVGGRDRGKYTKPRDKVKKWIFADIVKEHNPDVVLSVDDMNMVESESIDVVSAIELFEHVRGYEKGLQECYRVLRKGGKLIMSVPFLYPIHADPHDYQRLTEYKLRQVLAQAGFYVIDYKIVGLFFTVLGDMLKMLTRSFPRAIKWVCYIFYPILDLLVLLDRTNFVQKNSKLNKYHGGYFFVLTNDYDYYVSIQLKSAINDLNVAINTEIREIKKRLSAVEVEDKKYNDKEVELILAECENLIKSVPGAESYWTNDVKVNLRSFLIFLPQKGHLVPKEFFDKGKRRDYREHVALLTKFIDHKDDIILDVAGRTGWVSTILGYLGYNNAFTIELNPLNVIGGRYIWGHKHVLQGDAGTLRNCYVPQLSLDLSSGNKVDVIFVRYSIEHFLDLAKVYAEFNYVLKPGGKLFIIAGQSFDTSLDTGDLHDFPTIESVYEEAKDFEIIFSEMKKNSETKINQYFVCLKKKG